MLDALVWLGGGWLLGRSGAHEARLRGLEERERLLGYEGDAFAHLKGGSWGGAEAAYSAPPPTGMPITCSGCGSQAFMGTGMRGRLQCSCGRWVEVG